MERLIAHRGASGYAPENTLAAFEKARSLGARWIEFDVMLSADGEAFVFHDDTLKRTTNGRGSFGLVESDYLRTLDAGSWFSKAFRGERILSFQDAIAWLVASDCQANIEIKPYPGQTSQTTTKVLNLISRYWPEDKELPLVSSFDLNALSMCRAIAPELPIGLLLDQWQEQWLTLATDLACYSVHLSKRAAKMARVQEIKQQGYKVFVYTVNRKRQAAKLFGWGVDAVFSDYPDLLADLSI